MPQFLQNLRRYANNPLEFVNGVVRVGSMIGNEIEYGRKQVRGFIEDVVPEPIVNTLDSASLTAVDIAQIGYENSLVGRAEQGAIILGGNTAETFGLPRGVGEFVGGALAPGLAAPAPSAITRATRAATKNSVKTAVKETAEGLKTIGDDLMPPPPAALATAGATPQMQLNASRGSINLSPQVMDLTITDPEFLAPGVREGIAKDPAIAKQIVDRSTKVEKQANRLTSWIDKELSALTPKELKVAKKNQKKARADFYSQMSNMPQIIQDDPIAYRKQQFKSLINKEQHHLISKAQTSGFYDQMDYMIERGMADLDDLVAMGEYAKMRQASSGDVTSNILNMHEVPHNEFHTYLRDTGQELKPEQIKKMVRKAKSADELMEMYKDFIDNQLSVKEDAKAYQKLFEMDNPKLYK
jgi:hypothetical protein